ncbi:hypothetical protein N9S81_00035 [bacterium]|nr:hypothetical protein [bacterium]
MYKEVMQHDEERAQPPVDPLVFDRMTTSQRIEVACKLLGMTALGVLIGVLFLTAKYLLGMER